MFGYTGEGWGLTRDREGFMLSDGRGLLSGYRLDSEAVLNGIAYDAARNRMFVTGKLWPRLFEIEVVLRK